VTVFEPASQLQIQGQIGPFQARISYLLEPTDSGTRLRNAVDLGSSGPLTLVAPLAASRVKHAVAANLGTLKQLLNSAAGVGMRRGRRDAGLVAGGRVAADNGRPEGELAAQIAHRGPSGA